MEAFFLLLLVASLAACFGLVFVLKDMSYDMSVLKGKNTLLKRRLTQAHDSRWDVLKENTRLRHRLNVSADTIHRLEEQIHTLQAEIAWANFYRDYVHDSHVDPDPNNPTV